MDENLVLLVLVVLEILPLFSYCSFCENYQKFNWDSKNFECNNILCLRTHHIAKGTHVEGLRSYRDYLKIEFCWALETKVTYATNRKSYFFLFLEVDF